MAYIARRHEGSGIFSFGLILSYLIKVVFAIVEFLIGLRVLLLLFGANPANGFVAWVYDNSQPLVAPFQGIFPTVSQGRFIVDFSALFAMVVYAFVVWLVNELIDYLTYQSDSYHHHEEL